MLSAVLVLANLLLAQSATSTSFGYASITVRVRTAPSLDDCKMTPEERPPVAFQTRFSFSCARSDALPSTMPLYKVFHANSESSPRHLLYRGSEPRAEGLLLPSGEHWLWAQVEDKFEMRNNTFIGTVMLEEKHLELSAVRDGIQKVQSFLLKGDTQAAISEVTLTAYVIKDLYMQGRANPTQLDFAREDLLQLLDQIPFDTVDDTENNLSAIANIIQTSGKYASKRTQQMTADLLVRLSDSLAATASEPGEIIPESRLKGDGHNILGIVGDILDMQEEAPVTEKDVDADDQIVKSLQRTVKSVGDALLVRRQPGEVISVNTPTVELKAVRSTGAEDKLEPFAFSNVTVSLPMGIGQEDAVSLSATPANPLWKAPTDFASGFITVTSGHPMEQPIEYKFARSAKVSIEVGAPNVALMNITGMAHCVRYLNMPRRYGWRVIDDVLGEATVVVPAHGRTTVKMFLVSHSAQISRAVVTLEFQYHKHTIGKICAPRKDTQQILNYKSIGIMVTRGENGAMFGDVHIDNKAYKNADITMTVRLSYTSLMLFNEKVMRECNRQSGRVSQPVDILLKVVQVAGQCVVYDQVEKEFKPDISCRAFPDIFDITCQCLGASTHSAIVLPETNTINIHMIIKRLTTNHAPLILMITLVLLFFVLTIAAALIDRRDQKRLRPQVCQEAATLPCTYNVFIYTYLFRFHPGSDSDFILTLNGERNVYANDFINPTATYGSMLNLVFHAPYNLGSLMNITIRLMDANESWHVDRIIVCDSLSGENALFRVNGFVSFQPTVVSRVAEGKEEWWYEFLGRLCRDVISSIPVLLIFLPGRVRSLKLDYMLCYALAICIWVVTDIMFFLEQDELFREDVCLEATETRAQWFVTFLFKLSTNFVIVVVATLISRGIGKISLAKHEHKPSQDPKIFGFIPLSHGFVIACRMISFTGVVISLMAMAMMAYSLASDALNQWLRQLAEAFIMQVVSQCLRSGMLHNCRLFYYFLNRKRFLEKVLNPEGDRIACPECSEYLVIPLNKHMKRHQKIGITQDMDNLFDGDRIFPKPPVLRQGPAYQPTVQNV